MKWLKRMLIALAVLLVIAVTLPFFISLNDYIPRIEKEVSARLKEPVSIKSIKFATLPFPHVTVDGITVGKTDDIKLGKVMVTPGLFSLLQSTRVIKSIEIDSLALTRKAIDKIPAWAKSDAAKSPQPPPQVRVESIRLNNALVNFGKTSFGPFDARVSLDSQGEPEDASITTQDGKLKALIKPDKSKYLIDASAKSWTLPVGPALVLDELSIKGVATHQRCQLGRGERQALWRHSHWQNDHQLAERAAARRQSRRQPAGAAASRFHAVTGHPRQRQAQCQTGFLRLGGIRRSAYECVAAGNAF